MRAVIRTLITVFALGITVASLAAWKKSVPFASSELMPRSGSKAHGKVELHKTSGGIIVALDLSEVPPGEHAIHVHENGSCAADDASSAGGHFNPGKHQHGGPTSKERHPGDFGNFLANAEKKANVEIRIEDPAQGFDWNQIIGKTIIVHADKDDLKSQPAGNSGARIACGVIRKKDVVAE